MTIGILALSAGCLPAQKPEITGIPPIRFTEIKNIKGSFLFTEVDALDNLYVITRDFQLKKYNAAGDSMTVWNDVRTYGNPTMLDVSNPLRILIYYKPFATVVILDRFLAFRHAINLRKEGIFKVNAVANSYDNNIWLFDEQDMKMKKINDDGKLIFETADWRMLFESAPSPFRIIDHENSVYIFDKESGWYIFDYYGSLKKRIPGVEWGLTGKSKDFVYGFSDKIMHTAELPALRLKDYALPENIKGSHEIRVMNSRAYILRDDGIHIFSLENR